MGRPRGAEIDFSRIDGGREKRFSGSPFKLGQEAGRGDLSDDVAQGIGVEEHH
jgi:hypothetical protein